MFNITNILVKIFAWALIFYNSVQLEIRTFRLQIWAKNHIFGHDMSGFLQKTLLGMSQWLNNPSQWQARRRRWMVEVSERKTE